MGSCIGTQLGEWGYKPNPDPNRSLRGGVHRAVKQHDVPVGVVQTECDSVAISAHFVAGEGSQGTVTGVQSGSGACGYMYSEA